MSRTPLPRPAATPARRVGVLALAGLAVLLAAPPAAGAQPAPDRGPEYCSSAPPGGLYHP